MRTQAAFGGGRSDTLAMRNHRGSPFIARFFSFFAIAVAIMIGALGNMRGATAFVPVTRSRSRLASANRIAFLSTKLLSSVSPEASTPTSSINTNSTRQHAGATVETSKLTSPAVSETARIARNVCWDRLFDLDVPEGRCVGLELRDFDDGDTHSLDPEMIARNSSHWIHSLLHPEEVAIGLLLPSKARRETFFIGRIAVREALGILQYPHEPALLADSDGTRTGSVESWSHGIPPILKDEHGRPTMPKGYVGSISHKGRAGVGIVARDDTYSSPEDPPKVGIGIDLEYTTNTRRNIARRVLTEDEIRSLGQLEGVTAEEEVMLRFSLKECIYKSVHPLISQYVGFQEAEVAPHSNGTATVTWKLKSGAHERLGEISAHWRRLEGGEYFLSSSSAALREEAEV